MAKTLEEILQAYFGCSVPFRKDGDLTTTGITAYKKLEELLYDLEGIGVIPSASAAVRVLDEITHDGDEPEHKTVIDKAIDYVQENLEADELAEIRAQVDRSYRYHMMPSDCVTNTDRVIELLGEYGMDYEDVSEDEAEDWWSPHLDLDDILLRL